MDASNENYTTEWIIACLDWAIAKIRQEGCDPDIAGSAGNLVGRLGANFDDLDKITDKVSKL